MRVFAFSDQTIRVPRQHVGPTRELPTHFAPVRPRRWPYLAIAILAAAALACVVVAMYPIDRSAEARELLRLLGR